MLAYLLAGIAAMLASLFWFFPQPVRNTGPVVGQLEARYRSESEVLISIQN